jgi:MipA family protein
MRGLATDLLRTDTWRANLALRIDSGRQTQDSAALTGLADIQRTVRGRLIVSHDFGAGWGATLGVSADLLGRGGGTLVDFGPSKDIPLQLGEPWQRMRIALGVAVTGADRRYMQSYFGVTAQQATVTGYTEYSPSSGLRDISAGIALRGRYGEHWIGYVGVAASRLLGPALASPLTQQAASWSLNGGIAYRFH